MRAVGGYFQLRRRTYAESSGCLVGRWEMMARPQADRVSVLLTVPIARDISLTRS